VTTDLHHAFSRRRFLAGAGASSIGIAALGITGCGDDAKDPKATAVVSPPAASKAMKLVAGWYKGKEAKYYDFGGNTKLAGLGKVGTAPLYVFINGKRADGTPDFFEGQHNIATLLPGDAGYSDLWQINLVTVPGGYKADGVRSKADLDKAGFKIEVPGLLVNCPIVAEGTTFEGGEKLVQGWRDAKPVFYPDFGENSANAVPIWVLMTGMDDKGVPKFVKDQGNIIDLKPGDPGYSAFWQVNMVTVPAGYKANTLKSADDVRRTGYAVTAVDMVVNCPVVKVSA
jgi:hypothetical protein